MIPISTVLGNCLHLLIQIALLLTFTLAFGNWPSRHWLWLPFLWTMEISFVCGLSLLTSALNVFIRDTRYVVESLNAVLFWLVPTFYSFDKIPQAYAGVYECNPVAALVMSLRKVLLEGVGPNPVTIAKLTSCLSSRLRAEQRYFAALKQIFTTICKPMEPVIEFENVSKSFRHGGGSKLLRDRLRDWLKPRQAATFLPCETCRSAWAGAKVWRLSAETAPVRARC